MIDLLFRLTPFGLAAAVIAAVWARRVHVHKRRRQRACTQCGSLNVERTHSMRQLIGRTYVTSTTSRCLDCRTGRCDKPPQPKMFKEIDLIWRRWFYHQQFVQQHTGPAREHLQYQEGDFTKSIARQFPIAHYFGDDAHKRPTQLPRTER